jgi:lipoate-protein ligase B
VTRGAERVVVVTDLGRMPYREAWDLQRRLVRGRKEGSEPDRLLFVEHDPVITLGRRARSANVLLPADLRQRMGVEVYEIERGGDATVHGPGQQTAYPVLDLRGYGRDVRWYARSLLEWLVRTLQVFGIEAEGREGVETGVWVPSHIGGMVDDAAGDEATAPSLGGADRYGGAAKIAALGVRVESWVTYHGVALNVDPDLAMFDWIVPCGLVGARVTSMARLLCRPVPLAEVRPSLLATFGQVFDARLTMEGAWS